MQIFVPKTSAILEFEGARVTWVRGKTTIAEGHPILRGRESMVEPLKVDFPVPVRQDSTPRATSVIAKSGGPDTPKRRGGRPPAAAKKPKP